MARVKICPHNHANEPSEMLCTGLIDGAPCNYPLGNVPLSDEAPARSIPGAAATASGEARAGAASSGAVLSLPWGDVPVTGALFVGRDSDFSPIASELAQLLTVSGRHAEVTYRDGVLSVRDLQSSNGTFVRGRRIGDAPERLLDGDEVAFSSKLVAKVRLPV